MQSDQTVDFTLVSDEPAVRARCEAMCGEFNFSFRHWPSIDSFLENHKGARFILASISSLTTKEGAAELAQGIRFVDREAYLLCTVPGTIAKEGARFAKQSGSDLILVHEEIAKTVKLEFAALHVLKSSLIPVKMTDLKPGVALPFDLFHLLPMRGKFLRFHCAGDTLSEEKFLKSRSVGEMYIQKSECVSFNRFVLESDDRSASGLARRCRSQFLALHSRYTDLLFLLTDQSEHASYGEGKALFEECRKLCDSLLGTLAEFGDAWEVINNSAIGQSGTVDRSPAIAAYAGLIALKGDIKEVDQVMLTALLADIGLLMLPPGIIYQVQNDRVDRLSEAEKVIYRNYPNLGLELLFGRKFSIEEKFRNVLLSTQERADGSGFPRALIGEKISLVAQLVQFCRDYDRRTMLRMGKLRSDRNQIVKDMFLEDGNSFHRYTPEFWKLIRKTMNLD